MYIWPKLKSKLRCPISQSLQANILVTFPNPLDHVLETPWSKLRCSFLFFFFLFSLFSKKKKCRHSPKPTWSNLWCFGPFGLLVKSKWFFHYWYNQSPNKVWYTSSPTTPRECQGMKFLLSIY